jgi:hypothetical protein
VPSPRSVLQAVHWRPRHCGAQELRQPRFEKARRTCKDRCVLEQPLEEKELRLVELVLEAVQLYQPSRCRKLESVLARVNLKIISHPFTEQVGGSDQ